MEFFSTRELRTNTKSIWENLSKDNDIVITNNGKPWVLMVRIPEGRFDETVRVLKQAKAIVAMNRMRNKAEQNGFMSDEEINEAISSDNVSPIKVDFKILRASINDDLPEDNGEPSFMLRQPRWW